MARIHDLYQLLQTVGDTSVDRAMAAALPTADPLAAQLIVLLLLQRQQPEDQIAVVLHFHRLPDEIQATVIHHAAKLYRPLREASTHTNSDGPANVVAIVRRSGLTKLAYLVADLLRQGPADLRADAADCLLELAQRIAPEPWHDSSPSADVEAVIYLQNAVEQAVALYRHHKQPQVLLAMATLAPRPMPKAVESLSNRQTEAVEAVRHLLAQATEPAIRRAAVPLMLVPPLTAAALDCVRHCDGGGTIGQVMSQYPLLRIGPIAVALRRLSDLDMPWLTDAQADRWPAHQSRGLPDWIMALPMQDQQRLDALARLIRLADPMTRLAALRRLMELQEQEHDDPAYAGVNNLIRNFCFDAHPAVATIALRHLIRMRWAGLPKLLLQLVNAEYPKIARLAGDQLAPVGFNRFWASWPRLDPEQQLAAGRALIKLDPNFHSQLADHLASDDVDERLRALTIIHALNQGELFEEALLTLAQDEDHMIVSAAIKALGTAASEAAHEAIANAMTHHPDSRVRANAVEALQQHKSVRHIDQLVAMAEQEDNRPRANAIQALLDLRTADALKALGMMLQDDRAMHRTSALWLVETAGLIQLARTVAEMSITDPDRSVKQRANRVIHEMIDAMASKATADTAPTATGTPQTQTLNPEPS